MLTDNRPTIQDSDEYIVEWARARGGDKYPKCFVSLITASITGPDMAEIAFDTPGFPVRRFRSNFTTGTTWGESRVKGEL